MAGGGYGALPALLPPPSSRRRKLRSFLVRLSLFAGALLAPAAVSAAELHGRVVRVSDGDTITVLDRASATHKVRLNGIDAPENNQAYGEESRRHLATLVLGKPVVVNWHKRDRYGRLVGRVGLAATACVRPDCPRVEDVGLAQVESGLAWHYRQYQREQSAEERARYAFAEQEARSRRKGLWQDAQPVPPWEYRGSGRTAAVSWQ
jgi:endonuclease YncB( thermonuclease family)